MGKIKGEYIATLTLRFDVDEKEPGLMPLEKIQNYVEKDLAETLESVITKTCDDYFSVSIDKKSWNVEKSA